MKHKKVTFLTYKKVHFKVYKNKKLQWTWAINFGGIAISGPGWRKLSGKETKLDIIKHAKFFIRQIFQSSN